mmetsp:Transcript_6110/g.23078  ORF Transcript_6110/g.23078 Transcript_6110/m.23078 type:complete len:228 (+) Transcript_6110:5637-6320(+)
MSPTIPVCASHTHKRAAAPASARSFWYPFWSPLGTTEHRVKSPGTKSATPCTLDSVAVAPAAPPTDRDVADLPIEDPAVLFFFAASSAAPCFTTAPYAKIVSFTSNSALSIQAPTTVVVIALPARSLIWPSDSLVNSKSSTGMPCKDNASIPTNGPPRFVTNGTMEGVRHGQIPAAPLPVVRSTFWDRFHTKVLCAESVSACASRRKSMSIKSSTRSVCALPQSFHA